MCKEQKEDTKEILKDINNFGVLDYVSCWYKKASDYITNTDINCAFISTNSICQGEQVSVLWKSLFLDGIHINFAHNTFRWDSEANIKARVHCVIIGFSKSLIKTKKIIFDNDRIIYAENINPYLINGVNIFIDNVREPICNVPPMFLGCDFKDGDFYIFSDIEKEEFLKKEPQAEKFIKPYVTGRDFINRKPRYCLWLKDAKPEELKKCPYILERIKKVKEFRENSKSNDTKRYAKYPTRPARLRYYSENRNTNSLALPRISSQSRRYVPMEILDKNTIGGASILMIPNINLFLFGILTSNVHMAWMRTVCGRMKSDYIYSNGVVYNTFPFGNSTQRQKERIEKTAQNILNARKLYPNSSLADLYDDLTMPVELRKAHQENDKAVMEAYGFNWRTMTESDCVAELMKMYQEKIKNLFTNT